MIANIAWHDEKARKRSRLKADMARLFLKRIYTIVERFRRHLKSKTWPCT